MKRYESIFKRSKRLVGASLGVALGAVVLTGCDSAGGQGGDPDPEPTACGGFGVLCTVSGAAGDAGSFGDGGPAIAAKHYWPMDVTIGPAGEVYIVDWNNHRVRKIDPNTGIMTSPIGAGSLGDDSSGPADQIDLNHPTGLTIGDDGHFYLATWHNWKIKLISKNTMQVSAPVGTTQGLAGDGGPAGQAQMDLPSSVVFDFDGNMYISDQANFRIRKVAPDGTISTFAGGERGFADGVGAAAQFDAPKGPDATPGGKLAINDDRTVLYMADTFNHRIRMINLATGEVSTIAGNGTASYSGDGGPAAMATLNEPVDVHLSHDNELYIADSRNNVIRKIDANGIISTVAGTGERGVSPDETEALQAKLNRPMGVVYDESNHTLYIADTFNHQVKRVELGHDE